jgi:hypothetical protein
VLVVEEKVRKSPDNLILGSTGHAVSKADRMLRALRLANEGDVHIGGGAQMLGRVLSTRPAGCGFSPEKGATMQGTLARWPGATYSLAASDAPRVQLLVAYMRLATTSGHGYEPRPLRKRLDSLLQDAQQRSALRAAMGLAQIVATNGP